MPETCDPHGETRPIKVTGGRGDSFERSCLTITALMAFLVGARAPFGFDTWWHLASGRWMIEHGSVLRNDVFSFTKAGEAWPAPNWLSDLALYGLHALGGVLSVHLLIGVLLAATACVLWQIGHASPTWRTVGVGLFIVLAAPGLVPRPLAFGLLFTAVAVFILERARGQDLAYAWWLIPLFLLWANFHGSFAVGLGLVTLYGVGEFGQSWISARRWGGANAALATRQSVGARFFLVASLGAAACAVNPFGFRVFLYPIDVLSTNALGDFVDEWQAPDLTSLAALPLLITLAIAIALLFRARARVEVTDALLLIVCGALALTAVRNGTLLAVATIVIIGRYAPDHERRLEAGSKSSQSTVVLDRTLVGGAALLVGLMAVPAVFATPASEAASRGLPVGAVEFIRAEQPAGPMFNLYDWGGYLIWALPEEYPTFVDGRTDLFGDAFMDEYARIERAVPGWQVALDDWRVQLVLTSPESPLGGVLKSEGWTPVFHDEMSVVYTRDGAG